MITVRSPDPSWSSTISKREAVLWVGPAFARVAPPGKLLERLVEITRRPWAAAFLDCPGLPWAELKGYDLGPSSLEYRFYDREPGPEQVTANKLPVYNLRGPRDAVSARDTRDLPAYLCRVEMFKRAPANLLVFALGIDQAEDAAGLIEAAEVNAPGFTQFVIIGGPAGTAAALDAQANRLFHWETDWEALRSLLDAASVLSGPAELMVSVALLGGGERAIDLSGCVQPDHPITATFDLVPASQLRTNRSATQADVEAFLADPTISWFSYAAGIPYPRYLPYERPLKKLLKRIGRNESGSTITAWIGAEDGSGATSLLRQLCFALANAGQPILVARPDVDEFDFRQLEAFLRNAAERMSAEDIVPPPWVIAFDVQHTERHSDFIAGLANGLRKLGRSAVVLGVCRSERGLDLEPYRVLGGNEVVGTPISNSVSHGDAEALGIHLNQFLPPGLVRQSSEWREFVASTIRTTIEGPRCLFWVALRFWLMRVLGAEQPVRQWLAQKFEATAKGDPSIYCGLLDVAVLAKHRLAAPLLLLKRDSAEALRGIALNPANPLGLRLVRYSLTFAHPLIAEELLRISVGSPAVLTAVEKDTCLNLLDLELHLLGRLVARPEAGDRDIVPLVEELVVTGLRVDPQEAPRNYAVRERIVNLLEQAPVSLWDRSQVFNHHVAKARRHLAKDPPHSDWTIPARREQLVLAQRHLDDALHHIVPEENHRGEDPLNLWVSLSLTYDVRAQLEQEAGDNSEAKQYDKKAADAFAKAQKIDPDNTYVLENYARFKLRQAEALPTGEEKVRLLVEAIAFLEHELEVDPRGTRGEPILVALGRAYRMLGERDGGPRLEVLAQQGCEAALVALAKLTLHDEEGNYDDVTLAEAERLLLRVPPANVTWRSRHTLYRVVSQLRPHDFVDRLDLLEELDAFPEFAWPLQLRLDYAILLFQSGDPARRLRGKEAFRRFRDEEMPASGAPVEISPELKFLRDPATGFRARLKTSIRVKTVSDVGKTSYGVPEGWQTVDVAFRQFWFGRDHIKRNEELDCYIEFSTFGPRATPRTAPEDE